MLKLQSVNLGFAAENKLSKLTRLDKDIDPGD